MTTETSTSMTRLRVLRQDGFSLVELVVIVMILGALSVFALGRFSGSSSFDARGYYDELSSAARYAQRYAIASGCGVQFQVDSTGYSLTVADPCPAGVGDPVQHPGGGAFTGSAPAGITASGLTVVYDPHGDVPSGGTINLTGGFSITITDGSGFVVAP